MKYKYVSDVLSCVEEQIKNKNAEKAVKLMGENLTNLIESESAFKLIDNMQKKYPPGCDSYKLLGQVPSIWDEIPWHVKIKLISVCFFSKNIEQNIFITFAILAILSEIKPLFKPLH